MLDGIWHTSLVVHNSECSYGVTGIEIFIPPGSTALGKPRKIKMIGTTNKDLSTFSQHLNMLELNRFTGTNYHLMWHNCNIFSQEIISFLCPDSSGVPEDILELPERVKALILRHSYIFKIISYTLQLLVNNSEIFRCMLTIGNYNANNNETNNDYS